MGAVAIVVVVAMAVPLAVRQRPSEDPGKHSPRSRVLTDGNEASEETEAAATRRSPCQRSDPILQMWDPEERGEEVIH